MKKQFKLTKGKYEEIKQELYNLRTVKEREIAEQIKEAIEQLLVRLAAQLG